MSDAETRRIVEQWFDEIVARTEIVFVPDKDDPFNLDKTMVWFITEPDPIEETFGKLKFPDGSKT